VYSNIFWGIWRHVVRWKFTDIRIKVQTPSSWSYRKPSKKKAPNKWNCIRFDTGQCSVLSWMLSCGDLISLLLWAWGWRSPVWLGLLYYYYYFLLLVGRYWVPRYLVEIPSYLLVPGTAATLAYCTNPDDKWGWLLEQLVEWKLAGETEVLGENSKLRTWRCVIAVHPNTTSGGLEFLLGTGLLMAPLPLSHTVKSSTLSDS
jgi:hypothetical protein